MSSKLSPWIGISLLVIIIVILLFILYFTWWLYNTYNQDREDIDNAMVEIRKLAELSLAGEGVNSRNEEQLINVATNDAAQKQRRKRGAFASFFSGKRLTGTTTCTNTSS